MPDESVIVEPGHSPAFEASSGRGRGPRRLGIAAMVATAFLLGWLLRSPGPTGSEQTEGDGPSSTVAAAEMSPSSIAVRSDQAVVGVPPAEAVPGFTDTITAMAWDTHGIDLLRWLPSGSAPETMVSLEHAGGSWDRAVDASGRWYSEIANDFTLVVRLVDGAESVWRWPTMSGEDGGLRVTSSSWHETDPGRLAWLARPPATSASSAVLYTADVAGGPDRSVVVHVPSVAGHERLWLAGWGEWGMLLKMREPPDSVVLVLLDPAGEEVARGRTGPDGLRFVAGSPDGTTLWTEAPGSMDATSFVLSADGRQRIPVPGLAAGEAVLDARWSPHGAMLALCPRDTFAADPTVRIVDAATGSVVAEFTERSWSMWAMTWSTDDRFLIYERWPSVISNWAGVPQEVELVVYDTATDTRVTLAFPRYAAVLRTTSGAGSPPSS